MNLSQELTEDPAPATDQVLSVFRYGTIIQVSTELIEDCKWSSALLEYMFSTPERRSELRREWLQTEKSWTAPYSAVDDWVEALAVKVHKRLRGRRRGRRSRDADDFE